MKSQVEKSEISSDPVVSPNPEPVGSPIAATQLNSESMDGDTKKTMAYAPNRHAGYRKLQMSGGSNTVQ